MGYIVYIFYLQMVCLIGGFVLSFMARSELNMVGAKGSWPVAKTKLALLLYMIYLIINVAVFALVFIILLLFVVIFSKAGGEGGAAGGIFFTIIILLLLPFALIWVSQLQQCCKMRDAALEIEGTGQLNSTM